MAISATTSNTSAAAQANDPLASATQASSALGKDAFMKLLVAQISHQDPLKPMDDTAFVSQLAQFSALEQSMGMNQRLDLIAQGQQGLANSQVAGLVGKSVTVKGSTVALDGSGFSVPVNYTLGDNAATISVAIQNASGQTVRTMQVAGHQAGLVTSGWDGRNDAGIMQNAGAYTVKITAKNAAGAAIDVSQESTGLLSAVSFDAGYTKLILDNGVSAPASDLLRVNK